MTGLFKGAPYEYVRAIGYDEFEQRTRLELGNGVVTEYAYEPTMRRLDTLTSATQGRTFQNLSYGYDLVGNILTLDNTVPLPWEGKGGAVSQTFTYDDLYRLTEASGEYTRDGSTYQEYTLGMDYDAIHRIERKNQRHTIRDADGEGVRRGTTYDWHYAYNGRQPHAPTHIGERESANSAIVGRQFRYDLNGNQLGWTSDRNANRRNIIWD